MAGLLHYAWHFRLRHNGWQLTNVNNTARRALVLFDLLTVALVAAFASFALPHVAYAYVDPSVMTYTIQAVAGVAVALAAVAGVALRRTRRWLVQALGIDENARKDKEPEITRTASATFAVKIDGEEAAPIGKHAVLGPKAPEQQTLESEDAQADAPTEGKRRSDGYVPKWWQRLIMGALVSVFVAFTVMVVAPYEIVGGSDGSLLFALRDVWSLFVLPAAMAAAVATLLLTVLRGRVFNAVLMVLFSFGLCCYIQVLFLNGGLPPADGNAIAWGDYAQQAGISALVWAVVLLVPWLASHLNFRIAQVAVTTLAVALVVVQGAGVTSLFSNDLVKMFNPDIKHLASEYALTDTGMFTVSPNSNVIVFVLDMYDTYDLQLATQNKPDLLNEMTGFTWFKDSVGSMIPTRYGLPFLVTGQYPQVGEKFSTFLTNRYERSPFLGDIYEAGYSIGLYSDTLGAEYMPENRVRELIYDRTINYLPPEVDSGPVLDEKGAYAVLMRCALYRDLPWLAKPFFWYHTDEVNNAMVDFGSIDYASNGTPYTFDDARWFENLKTEGLTIQDDEDGYYGAYRLIHLLGTHYPYNIDEEGRFIGEDKSDRERQAIGSMHMVSEYLVRLKQMGLYDCSTIIITADHGNWYITGEPLEEYTSPILLVKPAWASDEECEESYAPVCAYDVLPTVMAGIAGGDAGKYGRTVYEIDEDESRERPYYATLSRNGHDWKILEYSINWDVSDFSSWERTGVEWDPQQ